MPRAWCMGFLRGGAAKKARARATRGSILLVLLLVQMGLAPIGAEIASDEPSFSVDRRHSKMPGLLTQNLDGLIFTSASPDLPQMKRHGSGGADIITAVLAPVLCSDLRTWAPPAATPSGVVFRSSHRPRGPPRLAA